MEYTERYLRSQLEKENRLNTCLWKQNNSFEQHNGHTAWVASSVYSYYQPQTAQWSPPGLFPNNGIISNIIYRTELQNKPNVALHNFKGFPGLFLLNT